MVQTATITMQGIADLAKVRRPVVSMWRKRSAAGADPFPDPVESSNRRLLFDLQEVSGWLHRTGHGNNASAHLDASAFELREDQDELRALAALIVLRHQIGSPIGDLSPAQLIRAAEDVDRDDVLICTEVRSAADSLDSLAKRADAAVDADYSSAAALRRVLQAPVRQSSSRSASAELIDLVDALVAELLLLASDSAAAGTAKLLLPSLDLSPLTRSAVQIGSAEVCCETRDEPQSADLRHINQLLALRDVPTIAASLDRTEPPSSAAIWLKDLPSTGHRDAETMLDEVGDIAISMGREHWAIIVGPASVLADRLTGAADRARSSTLRTRRVHAIVRLPRGLAPAAPRVRLAIWVLGPSRPAVVGQDALVLTADVHGSALADGGGLDLVRDIFSGVSDPAMRRQRAYRFGAHVPLRSLLASDSGLVAPRVDGPTAAADADVIAAYMSAMDGLGPMGEGVPAVTASSDVRPRSRAASVGGLVAARKIRRVPGTRLRPEMRTSDPALGVRLLTAASVRNATAATHFVDRLSLAALGASVRLTEPGDVIVVGGREPAAVVDELGAAVVERPAAILRVAEPDRDQLDPHVIAHDITRFGSGEWRTWTIRRIAPAERAPLADARRFVAARLEALRDEARRLQAYEQALVDGLTAGLLTADGDNTRKDEQQGGH